MGKAAGRILFLGFDGVEPELLRCWAADGTLPTVRSLLHSGAVCEPSATSGFGNGTAWANLFTGVNPARHGRYFFRQIEIGSYREYLFSADDSYAVRPFWEPMAEAGKRVAVVDVFRAPLSKGLHGLQVADWYTHAASDKPRTQPVGILNELRERFGDDPLEGSVDRVFARVQDCRGISDLLTRRIRLKTEMVRWLLARERWDLCMVVFSEAHDIGHVCWHRHHPSHPDFVPDSFDPIRRVYVELDNALATISNLVGRDFDLLFFAGLGMGPNYSANPVLDQILAELGAHLWDPSSRRKWFDRLESISTAIPGPVRSLLRTRFTRAVAAHGRERLRSRRLCFALPHNHHSGAVRFNLQGREPEGRVAPGKHFESACKDLSEAVRGLKDGYTHTPLVKEVVRVPEICKGNLVDALPDLLFVWNRDAPIRSVDSPLLSRPLPVASSLRTGDHTSNTLLIGAGPSIRSGVIEEQPRLEDIAPTIGHLVGLEIRGLEGELIHAMLRD